MASATVTLKEGKSYTYTDGPNTLRFTEAPVTVSGLDLINKLKGISQLNVDIHADKPVAPLKKVAPKQPVRQPARASTPPPPPEPEEVEEESEPEAEPEADEGDGEVIEEGDEETTDEAPADEEVVEEEPELPPPPVKAKKPGQFQVKGGKKA